MNTHPLIWVLADDRAGNVNQAIGVAEALCHPFKIKDINYTKYGSLPNIIRGASLMGVDKEHSSKFNAPLPDIVISAGRKTAPIARYIKKISHNKSKLVHLMWPGFPYGDFDLIATPKHDNIAPGGRIINTVGAPNRITAKLLEKKKAKWEKEFAYLPSPRVALLVGGDTKKGDFTEEHANDLIKKVSLFFQNKEGSLLITTSRRTSEKVTDILKNGFKTKFYFHDYHSIKDNPYFGYLAVSDAIITSGDSISMCSEACSTGKPVYIYAPKNITPEKHQNFHKNLYEKGYATPLSGEFISEHYTPLNDAKRIAEIIEKNYC